MKVILWGKKKILLFFPCKVQICIESISRYTVHMYIESSQPKAIMEKQCLKRAFWGEVETIMRKRLRNTGIQKYFSPFLQLFCKFEIISEQNV